MRSSHRQIRKMVAERKDSITDEELFTSDAYRGYLEDITEAATGRYGKSIHVNLFAEAKSDIVAYTDPFGIYINVCNKITWSMPERMLRALSLEGFNAHENGHNLFTDGKVWGTYFKKLDKGFMYPKIPGELNMQEQENAQKLLEAMNDAYSDRIRNAVMYTAKALSNILEDGYVDYRYSRAFPGTPANGIALNNMRYAESVEDIASMISNGCCDRDIMLSLLIQYVRSGSVNDLSGSPEMYTKLLEELKKYVDASIYEVNAKNRCNAVNIILVKLWDMILSSNSDNSNSKCEKKPNEGENSNFADNSALIDSLVQNTDLSSYTKIDDKEVDITNTMNNSGCAGMSTDGSGMVSGKTGDKGIGKSCLNKLEEMAAQEQAEKLVEKELAYSLMGESGNIDFGQVHENTSLNIERMTEVPAELIYEYEKISPELLLLSKKLCQSVGDLLKDRRAGGKQTGLYMGKKLDARRLWSDDGKAFYNLRLPTEPVNLAVGLLCDMSGSMASDHRIEYTKATAVVIQDFCERLGIPLIIYGHTSVSGNVRLFSFSEFDSVDRKDKYRLMDMSPRNCNRDGVGLRYVAEKLYKYPSESKLLIVITDGRPNDTNYTGSVAEEDLKSIQTEYSRKGITIFAAAIGDDRERIESIYGKGFLDITDLNTLPVKLTKLIASRLPI